MKISSDDVKKVVDGNLAVLNYVKNEKFSFVCAEINGAQSSSGDNTDDSLYFFLEGIVYVRIGENGFECHKNDLVIIPKKTKFELAGKGKCIIITSPLICSGNEERV